MADYRADKLLYFRCTYRFISFPSFCLQKYLIKAKFIFIYYTINTIVICILCNCPITISHGFKQFNYQ